MIRVVGGVAKGRRLKGARVSGVRLTSELVRGAIFNILDSLDIEPVRVLDLYAGSGSLGIEALSRGAMWADFVERHPRQCATIRANLAETNLADHAKVHCIDVERAIVQLPGKYDLVMMDPPYKLDGLDVIVENVSNSGLFNEGATLVVGHSKHRSLAPEYSKLVSMGSYRYGDSLVECYRWKAEP